MAMGDINKILDDIEDSLLKAEASYQLWWGFEHYGKNDYFDAMNDPNYVDFFHASIPLLLQSMLINLSRVFDRGRDLSGVRMLKETLIGMGYSHLATSVSKKLNEHESVIKSVKGIRDQSASHKKHEKTTSQIYQENPITPDEMKELMEITKEIIIEVSGKIGRNYNVLSNERYLDATVSLLSTLKHYMALNQIDANGAPPG